MKKVSMHQRKLWLVCGVFLTYFGMQISCTPENSSDRKVQVILQIPLPSDGGLKNATSIAGVKRVVLTVTAGNEDPISKELTILGNSAIGTISILPGKSIKFIAKAIDANNIVQWEGSTTVDIDDDFEVSIGLTPILPSATSLQAIQEEKSVKLSWNQNSDPDFARYELYRSQSSSAEGTLLQSITLNTKTEFKDSLALEGNTYFYTLVVTDTEGFKTESKANINPNYPLTASKLQLDFVSFNPKTKYYEAKLSWTQNSDKDFASYELYRSTSINEFGTIISSSPLASNIVYSQDQLLEGNIFFYTLVVKDTKGLETKSNMVQIDIPTIPPTASDLYGNDDGYVYLDWTRNDDIDFARYELYRSTSIDILGTKIESITNVNLLSYTDQSVIEGNTYYYRLIVYDTSGLPALSNKVTVVMYNYPPTASSLFVKMVSRNMVGLTWDKNNDLDFDRYELHRSQSDSISPKKIQSFNVNTSTYFEDTNVSPSSTYYYMLIVFDIKGLSTKSTFVYVNTPQ